MNILGRRQCCDVHSQQSSEMIWKVPMPGPHHQFWGEVLLRTFSCAVWEQPELQVMEA